MADSSELALSVVPDPQGGLVVAVVTPPVQDAPKARANVDPRFLCPLILEYLDGRRWRVVEEFDYHTDVYPIGVVQIPAGFFTDFASVPKLLWNVMPPTGKYGKAAVVHDYLYRTLGLATKAEADSVFLEAMVALGVGWPTRTIMYQGVKRFGGHSYKGGL